MWTWVIVCECRLMDKVALTDITPAPSLDQVQPPTSSWLINLTENIFRWTSSEGNQSESQECVSAISQRDGIENLTAFSTPLATDCTPELGSELRKFI
jgi:hypothetical protein